MFLIDHRECRRLLYLQIKSNCYSLARDEYPQPVLSIKSSREQSVGQRMFLMATQRMLAIFVTLNWTNNCNTFETLESCAAAFLMASMNQNCHINVGCALL